MKRVIPKFESEADEAKWWDEHHEELEQEALEVLESGKAQILTQERLAEIIREHQCRVTIELAEGDVKRAHRLAQARGLDYKTYIGTLLHEAIEREAGTQGAA